MMKTKFKKIFITIATTLSAILIVTTATYAIGTLTPSGTAGDATQYTLNDIYTKLTTGTATSTKTGSISVPGSVSASFRTLTEIYNSIPATLSLSNSTTTVPVGINRATTTLDAIDGDLVAANIADNVTIFGVEGTMTAGVSFPTEWSADDPAGYVGWATAVSYCDSLEENSHTDWRLPTCIELVNAHLTSNPGNTLGFQGENYWSSTEFPYNPDNAYYIYMYSGYVSNDGKTFPYYLARCAR